MQLYLSECHASHHGAIRRCHGVSCHPRAGRSGEWRPDCEGEAKSEGSSLWVVCVTSFPLQVSDRGGGVPLRKIDRLFTYTYSTAPRPSLDGRAAPLVSGPDTRLEGKRNRFLNWILPPAFPGWLRIRPPYLSTVRALLSGRLEALLPGGLWNRCSDLHPGDWFYVNTGFSLRRWRRSYVWFYLLFHPISGTVHRVNRETSSLQQIRLETLQDYPWGWWLVRSQ